MHKRKLGNAPNQTLEVIVSNPSDHEKKIGYSIINGVLALLVYIMLQLTVISMFQLDSIYIISFIPGLLILLVLTLMNKRTVTIMLIASLVIIIGIIFFGMNLFEGLLTTLNDIYTIIGLQTGVDLPTYKTGFSSLSPNINAGLFWMALSLVIAMIIFYVNKGKRMIVYPLLLIGIYLFQLTIHVQPPILIHIGLLFVILLQMFHDYIIGNKRTVIYGRKITILLYSLLGFISFFLLITFIFLNYVTPVSTYEKNTFVQQIQHKATSFIEHTRYEKGNGTILTEGKFIELSELDFPEMQALEIIMDEPTPLYLKGYVGSTYTPERWEDLSTDMYYDSHGLFYWLHDAGFYPLNQLSILRDVTDADIGSPSEMTVQNVHANSRYLYIPYELSSTINQLDKIKTFDQSHLESTELFGNRLYHYDVQTNVVEKYPALANEIYSTNLDGKEEEYLLNESHYNEHVYENYTEVPDHLIDIFNHSLDVSIDEVDEHIPYEVAIDEIKTYLSEAIHYNIDPEPLSKGQDFVTHTLEGSQEGYSTHFATVGTLMFRHLGIPARYVEGYIMTANNVEGKDSYEKISINEENAHAWTEIYIDKIGWIPIEVTPPYEDKMPEIDLSDYPTGQAGKDQETTSQDESSDQRDDDTQDISDLDDTTQHSKEDDDEKRNWSTYVTNAVILIIILLFLVMLLYVTKKRLAIRKLRRSLDDKNTTIATTKMFAYSLFLLHHDGMKERGGSAYAYEADVRNHYGHQYAELFKQAVKLNQVAQYSKHQVTEEEKLFMVHFMEKTITHVIQSKNLFQRLKMKYWDFIY